MEPLFVSTEPPFVSTEPPNSEAKLQSITFRHKSLQDTTLEIIVRAKLQGIHTTFVDPLVLPPLPVYPVICTLTQNRIVVGRDFYTTKQRQANARINTERDSVEHKISILEVNILTLSDIHA